MIDKKQISIRYWLIGKEYNLALKALEYAGQFHTGLRKDNSPEFDHQLSIVHYIKTIIPSVCFPDETLAAGFLHDTCEDYNIGFEEIESKFGKRISVAVQKLTKKHRGIKTPTDIYYNQISNNPIASIVKSSDRIHNIGSMVDVFSIDKQKEYISETEDFVLPMLKKARRIYLKQEPAYENAKHVLKSQIALIKAIHKEN